MNEEIAIGKLAQLIVKISGQDINIISTEKRLRPEKSEVDQLLCNNLKLLHKTNWHPTVTLKDGLKKVFEWMEHPDNLALYKPDSYNV
mgnify:FL=1